MRNLAAVLEEVDLSSSGELCISKMSSPRTQRLTPVASPMLIRGPAYSDAATDGLHTLESGSPGCSCTNRAADPIPATKAGAHRIPFTSRPTPPRPRHRIISRRLVLRHRHFRQAYIELSSGEAASYQCQIWRYTSVTGSGGPCGRCSEPLSALYRLAMATLQSITHCTRRVAL
jgi:hypothetical protein